MKTVSVCEGAWPHPVEVVEGGPELVELLLADALGIAGQDLVLHLVDGAGDGGQQLLPAHTDVLRERGERYRNRKIRREHTWLAVACMYIVQYSWSNMCVFVCVYVSNLHGVVGVCVCLTSMV